MNGILSGIFLIDFTYRLFTAESKARYFFRKFGWADLLASLPFQQVKVLRVFRLVRVGPFAARLRRQEHRPQPGPRPRRQRAAHAAADGHPGARVRQPRDPPRRAERPGSQHHHGVRCPLVQHRHHLDGRLRRPVPRHQRGRIVGSLIIVIGVGIFGTFTGYLANLFLAPSKRRPPPSDRPRPTNHSSTSGRSKR